ncbi:MAG: 3-oxoacyl-[acyl-carrier-protein] reductase [Candidatus Caldatribacteriota bacterium]|nr:3-oxoacyl-[acyl-carrier-protein] reductase [Candidatus Caldatribacteriota bacterium]
MLKGKVAIVTGASRGIGWAIALNLAKSGSNLILNYNHNESGAKELSRIIESMGVKSHLFQGDVSDFAQTEKMVAYTFKTFGRLDILINNAGINNDKLLIRMKEEDFDRVLSTNLKGTFNCIKHASKIMLKQRHGNIINISSVVGLVGNIGQSNYAASKAGIIGLTKSLAKELAPRGITVNAIAPGFIKTVMTEKLPDKIREKMLDDIPLKKFGEPEDVANLVDFLVSEKANYITGQVINVDGGMVM